MKRICHWLLAATILVGISATQIAVAQTTVGAEIHTRWVLHLNDHGLGKNYNYFEAHRGWLMVNHDFSEKFSANVIAEGIAGGMVGSNDFKFRLRSAYLQANTVIPYTDIRVGMQDLLWVSTVEDVWGLRHVDEVSLHKLGDLQEADLGVSAIAHCPGGYGILALQFLNGGGYTETEVNKYKDCALYGEAHLFPKNADWSEMALVGQYYKGYPNIADNSGAASFSENTKKDRLEGGVIIKYRSWISAFAEYFVVKDDFDQTEPADGEENFITESNGFTLMGRLYVSTTAEKWLSRVSLFGKYENVDRNRNAVNPLDQDEGDARYLTAGIAYAPVDNWEFAFAVKRNTININEGDLRIAEQEANSVLVSFRALIQ